MRRTKEDYLNFLYTFKYASRSNLCYETKYHNINKHISQLLEADMIYVAYQYSASEGVKIKKKKEIYGITESGAKLIGEENYRRPGPKAFDYFDHNTGLIDCIGWMFWRYGKDYYIEVAYEPKMKLSKTVINKKGEEKQAYCHPDAVVKLYPKKGLEPVTFIVEYERSRHATDILLNKIANTHEYLYPFSEYGLQPGTKILYILNDKEGNIERTNNLFDDLMTKVSGYSDRYLFAKYHDHKKFHLEAWTTASGKKVSLLN